MSGIEEESVSERELADYFRDEVFSGKPRSPSEAVEASEPEPEAAPVVEEPASPTIEVDDAPQPEQGITPEPSAEPELESEAELPPDPEADEDTNVAWAKGKYGDNPAAWAKAAYEQEQHISRLAREKREAEAVAVQWYEHSQQIQQEAQQQQQMAMPLSAQEEQWVEASLSNPHGYARQAAMSGNVQLYQGVIARVAEENPMLATQIGTAVQMEMQQLAAEQNGAHQPQATLQESLGDSISRLGIDLQTHGEAMSAKIAELGEWHPYVQTILEGEPQAREIALMAVYDLVRAGTLTTRTVRNEQHEQRIQREGELRRQAAGVVTGGPPQSTPPKQPAFMDAMEDEWRARGQWEDD